MDITLILSTFSTILLAELGDKTQLATFVLSGATNRPFAVFLGSSCALVLTSLLGAVAGGSISQLVPNSVLKAFAAFLFIYIGITLIKTALTTKMETNDK